MIIYEVNLSVQPDIFAEYHQWLMSHVEDMLQFTGFKKAEIAREKETENKDSDLLHLTVRYFIEHEQHLQDYLTHHAASMRKAAVEKFGDKFKAIRRVFSEALEVV